VSSTPSELGERQKRALRVASSFGGRLFRKMVWYFIRLILYPYFRVRGRNAHFLDTPGPVILAPVHRSNLDAPLLVVQTPRMIHALAKRVFSLAIFFLGLLLLSEEFRLIVESLIGMLSKLRSYCLSRVHPSLFSPKAHDKMAKLLGRLMTVQHF